MNDPYTATHFSSRENETPRLHDLDHSVEPLNKGHRVGSYEIRGVLGIGGFGVTYRALDLHLKQHVALKEYFPVELALRNDGNELEPRTPVLSDMFAFGKRRFLEEARTLARFKHPNIVRVLSFFQGNNTAYFAMDFEVGQSLKRLLASSGRLQEKDILELLEPLLDGLETMHAQGFIHRDVKPGNIYVRNSGVPVLLDFGAALRPEHATSGLGRTMLTPGYAPPEQYDRSTLLGPWTDIYGMAAVLHRAVSGVKPVESIIRMASIDESRHDPLPPAVKVGNGAFSQKFLQAVDDGLRIERGDRPQSVTSWRTMIFGTSTDRGEAEGSSNLGVLAAEPGKRSTDPQLDIFRRGILVEGDPENARVDLVLLQTLLEMRVQHTATGKEALALLLNRRADVLLCDDGPADMELQALLEASSRRLLWMRPPVVLVHSGLANDAFLARSIARGAMAFIQRPYAVEDMEHALLGIAKMEQAFAVEESLLQEASQLASQNKHARALKLFADILGMEEEANSLGEPGYTELSWRGMRQIAMRDYTRAIETCRRADSMLRILAEAHGGMGESSRRTGNMGRYVESAKKAAYQGKRFERMLTRRIELSELMATAKEPGQNKQQEAASLLESLGLRLLRLEDYAGALGAFNQALGLTPGDPALHCDIARTHAHLRNHRAARAHLEKALRLEPGHSPAERLREQLDQDAWPAPRE